MPIEKALADGNRAQTERLRKLVERLDARALAVRLPSGVDHAFEAVGIPALQELALASVRAGGVLTLAGLTPMGTTTNFPGAAIARQEKTIKGSYYGSVNPQRDFPMLVELYVQQKLDLEGLVTRAYRLDQINEAFRDMLDGKLVRGVIDLEAE